MASGSKAKGARSRLDGDSEVIVAGENVFADVGLPNPEVAIAKARLVQRIRELLAERKLTQSQAAELLGIDQPKVSALVNGRVHGYSLDRLLRYLSSLGQEVEIRIRPKPPGSRQRQRAIVVTV